MPSVPKSKPNLTLDKIYYLLDRRGYTPKVSNKVFCVAIRGYYLDTIGAVGQNDYNHYDDFIAWIWPRGYSAYNCNTDPTAIGWNPNAGKYMARLKPGIYDFVMRKHKGQYNAFGQGENKVTVERIDFSGRVVKTEKGLFGINIHRGGASSTSSEGCITVPHYNSPQWDEFQKEGYQLLKTHRQISFKFILFDEKEERNYDMQ